MRTAADMLDVEAAVRALMRVEHPVSCSNLLTMSYRLFRLRCLKAMRCSPDSEKQAFEAEIGNNIVLRYDDGIVSARLRLPSLTYCKTNPHSHYAGKQSGKCKRKRPSSVESYEVLGSDSN